MRKILILGLALTALVGYGINAVRTAHAQNYAFGNVAATAYTGGNFFYCVGRGIGDGLNAMAAGTYLQSTCKNLTTKTVTITSIQCLTDNSGTSTMNASNSAGTGLLTGAVTCTSSYAAGTQSATTTLAANDYVKFTFVADGTSKQSDWVVFGTVAP